MKILHKLHISALYLYHTLLDVIDLVLALHI